MIKTLHDKVDNLIEGKNIEGFVQTLLIIMGLFLAATDIPQEGLPKTLFSYGFASFVLAALIIYSNKHLNVICCFLLGSTFAFIFLIHVIPDGIFYSLSGEKNTIIFSVLYFCISIIIATYVLQYDNFVKKEFMFAMIPCILSIIFVFIFPFDMRNNYDYVESKIVLYAVLNFILLSAYSYVIYPKNSKKVDNKYILYPIALTIGSPFILIFYSFGISSNPATISNAILIENTPIILQNCSILAKDCTYNFTEMVKEGFPLIIFTPLTKS